VGECRTPLTRPPPLTTRCKHVKRSQRKRKRGGESQVPLCPLPLRRQSPPSSLPSLCSSSRASSLAGLPLLLFPFPPLLRDRGGGDLHIFCDVLFVCFPSHRHPIFQNGSCAPRCSLPTFSFLLLLLFPLLVCRCVAPSVHSTSSLLLRTRPLPPTHLLTYSRLRINIHINVSAHTSIQRCS
jgi:hypothetical protein